MQIALYLMVTTILLLLGLFLIKRLFKRGMYITLMSISILIWGLLVWICISDWVNPPTDANIGLGLLFFALWFFIAFLFLLVVIKYVLNFFIRKQ